ncbi:hypothetical protein Pan181_46510 [Aeoliella mucimassa]|uniref:YcxB-like C-terminal domain-containing protein n=2 Tax=Aeoliella mucimassa TaxID=2527972 RepID=A0A518AUM1_9BACT|nr:hypothetical protein Pan181_46510 [Aeoliella mucimassa]
MASENPYASPAMTTDVVREVPQLEPPQSITYQLTDGEAREITNYLSFNNTAYERYLKKRQRRFYWMGAIGAVAASCMGIAGDEFRPLFLAAVTYSALLFFAGYRLPARARKGAAKLALEMQADDKFGWMDQQLCVTLEEGGVHIEEDNGYRFRRWTRIDRLETSGGVLYLFFDANSAMPVPSRAFYDEAAFLAFRQLAAQLLQKAQGEPTAR